MFAIRTYACPDCSKANDVHSIIMSHSELAGAETWGVCWSCSRDFHLTAERRQPDRVEHLISATRTPIASNVVFRMWRPRLR
ncbi:MAG: hypothetical protein V3S62_09220 [Acidimicrobiia bacterium]